MVTVVGQPPVTYTYDNANRLTTITQGTATATYAWNARNQLTGITGTSFTASFSYDSFGRRTTKTINGVTTKYFHDGLNVVQEQNGTGGITANLLTGLGIDELLTRTDSVGARGFLTDALGTTIALVDNTGIVQTTYTYEPFGSVNRAGQASQNAFKYTGREDDATGLYYYRARYYHPRLQRFISEDPIGFGGGDADIYSYVSNAPTNSIDPLGQVVPLLPVLGVGAEVLAGVTQAATIVTGILAGAALGTAVVNQVYERGKEKGSNWATELAKSKAQTTGSDPCDVLAEMLKEAKCEGDTRTIRDIQQAQKFLNCRHHR